ncbi:exonuclease SbcCD subunit D [soil metagenome]
MKIIHTSDWHLGDVWHGFDRSDDLFRQVEQVCRIVEEKNAEVLLVAGDVFEQISSQSKLHRITEHLANIFMPLIQNGKHIILMPGNHDYREYFRQMKAILKLAPVEAERFHVVQGTEFFDIGDVQFLMIPYPSRELLAELDPRKVSKTVNKKERNRLLSNNFSDFVQSKAEEFIDSSRPSVLTLHIQIEGVHYASSKETASYDSDLCLVSNRLPTNVSYIALGHIHQYHEIPHPIPCRYCGSLDKMDLGEREDEKFVLLVDIDETTRKATVDKIRLDTSRFEDIATTAAELEQCAENFTERETIYGRLKIELDTDEPRSVVKRLAHKLFPRCPQVEFTGDKVSKVNVKEFENPNDHFSTVSTYLDERFKDDKDLPELKQMAEKLIGEVKKNAFTKN